MAKSIGMARYAWRSYIYAERGWSWHGPALAAYFNAKRYLRRYGRGQGVR